MNNTIKIVAISKVNGPHSELECKIKPQNFKDQMVLGITSFSHGKVFNVTDENNEFICVIAQRTSRNSTGSSVQVPPGRYSSTFDLLLAVSKVLKETFAALNISMK